MSLHRGLLVLRLYKDRTSSSCGLNNLKTVMTGWIYADLSPPGPWVDCQADLSPPGAWVDVQADLSPPSAHLFPCFFHVRTHIF